MRKNTTTPIELASTPESWRKVDGEIENAVEKICGNYEPEQTEAFLFLLDLMTNPAYDGNNREMVAFHAKRVAFRYTPEFEKAQEDYLNKINPLRVKVERVM